MQFLQTAARRCFYVMAFPLAFLLRPLKVYAYRTRFSVLRRIILEFTALIDFLLIWLLVQNESMLLHWQVFGGNFIFGKAVMVVDYDAAAQAITQPLMKNNNFMGVNIVSSNPDAFATNSGILTQSPPVRKQTRDYIDQHIFTRCVRHIDQNFIRSDCAEILREWSADPRMASTIAIRSTVIRIFFRLLSRKTITKRDADLVTTRYMRRFVELSLFSGYLPWLLGLLGTRQAVRRDVYFKLREYDIDMQTIDMTLFAALFSVGTLTLRCVEDLRTYGVVYEQLTAEEKRNLVLESIRLYPTVTTVHRVIEQPENVRVCGRELRLNAGDEIAYPFICINRDPNRFTHPAAMDLHRSTAEYEQILSWSKGPHDCPAKELSVLVTLVLLDTLSERYAMSDLKIFNPAF